MTDAPKRIWVRWLQLSGTGLAFSCQSRPPELRVEYILASEAEAMVAAAVREVAEPLLKMRKGIEADVLSAHQNRGNGASEWMREDDRDFRRDLTTAFDTLALIPQPASAALDKLIAEAVQAETEQCAKLAENIDYPWEQGQHLTVAEAADATARSIAAAIRAKGDQT